MKISIKLSLNTPFGDGFGHLISPLFEIFISLVVLLSFSKNANALSVEEYLATQTTIRVLVVNAPNFGHQMAAVAWMKRIRELGFTGDFEVIVEQYSLEKLPILIPELADSIKVGAPVPHIFLASEKMHIYEKSVFLSALTSHLLPQVNLAVVPAEDHFIKAGGGMFRAPAPGRPTPIKELGSRFVLRMQPFAWLDGSRYIEHENGLTHNLNDLRLLLMIPPKNILPTSSNNEVLLKWLKETITSATENEFLNLTKLLADSDHERLPFYSAHAEKTRYLTNLISGVINEPRERPIRIWCMSSVSDFQWQTFLNGKVASFIKDGKLKIVDLNKDTAFDLNTKSENRHRIELIRMPHAPPALFELLSRTATLPPVVTGKYGPNLMMSLGIPFLEPNALTDIEETLKLNGHVRAITSQAVSYINNDGTTPLPIHVNPIIQFWLLSKTDEARAQYASRATGDPSHDMVYSGLERTIKFEMSCKNILN
jgi:hypothetical protein